MKIMMSAIFNCHVPLYVGIDEYILEQDQASSGEAFRD